MGFTKHFKLHYWPQLTSTWFMATIIITFTISVLNGHVYIYFPYISDTGATPPESCVFGLMLGIAIVLLAITLYIRYRQVDFDISASNIALSKKWNSIAKWMPVCMCFGLATLITFQETAIYVIHLLGAICMFGIGSIYFLVQTRISFASRSDRTNPDYDGISKKLYYLRAFLSFTAIPLLVIVSICHTISMLQFTGKTMVWWTEEDGAFQLRLAGSFSEWILTIFILIYIFTFRHEFRSLKYDEIRFTSSTSNAKDVSAKVQLALDEPTLN